jgi:uncharacterized protein (TIGR03067 family)
MGAARVISLLCALAANYGATAFAGEPATAPSSKADLSGVWLVDSASNCPPSGLLRAILTLKDNTFSLSGYRGIEHPWTGTFAIDPQPSSRDLELRVDAFELSGTSVVYPACSLHGIYRLDANPDGDRLTICFAMHEDSPRPAEFKASDDARLVTFVRVEPDFATFPKNITVTVLDPGRKPAAGASVFNYMSKSPSMKSVDGGKTFQFDMKSPPAWHYIEIAKTDENGTATLPYAAFEDEHAAAAPSGAHDQSHNWTGFANISAAALRKGTLTIHMQPERMLRGTITSDVLTQAGKPIPLGYAYLFSYENRIGWCMAESGAFEFAVPPGEYMLNTYGNDLHGRDARVTIPAGSGDFVLPPISLEPSRILLITGEPAPTLRNVVAWKNEPIDLAALKGKVVLLDFWGYWCGPCVAEMPNLFRLHDKYKDKGLAIASVHVDLTGEIDSVAKLDEKTAGFRNGIWKGRDVPFPTALVSGRRREQGQCLAAADYGVMSYPTTIVIDRHGRIVRELHIPTSPADDAHADTWIEELLAAK